MMIKQGDLRSYGELREDGDLLQVLDDRQVLACFNSFVCFVVQTRGNTDEIFSHVDGLALICYKKL